MADLGIELAGEQVLLLPERALYWPRAATLFVADLHWGKAATFRAAAIPLPGGTTSADLGRLGRAIERSGAQKLVLLGDLLHARAGRAERTLAAIGEWRAHHSQLELLLVRGNHDRGAGDPPAEWRIACADEPLSEPPFMLRHYPKESAEGYTLAGHLHPAVAIMGTARQRLRLPCFLIGPRLAILPAFGGFTGNATLKPAPHDRVYAIADDEVIAL